MGKGDHFCAMSIRLIAGSNLLNYRLKVVFDAATVVHQAKKAV